MRECSMHTSCVGMDEVLLGNKAQKILRALDSVVDRASRRHSNPIPLGQARPGQAKRAAGALGRCRPSVKPAVAVGARLTLTDRRGVRWRRTRRSAWLRSAQSPSRTVARRQSAAGCSAAQFVTRRPGVNVGDSCCTLLRRDGLEARAPPTSVSSSSASRRLLYRRDDKLSGERRCAEPNRRARLPVRVGCFRATRPRNKVRSTLSFQ